MSEPMQAMRWTTGDGALGVDHLIEGAERIVAWMNRHGGEARYEMKVLPRAFASPGKRVPRIAVRTRDGWTYAKPGDTVRMGTATFEVEDGGLDLGAAGFEQQHRDCREFTVEPVQ